MRILKKVEAASLAGKNSIEFENIGGGVDVYGYEDGRYSYDYDFCQIELNGYTYSPSPIFSKKKPDSALTDEKGRIEFSKQFKKEHEEIKKFIFKLCENMDKEIKNKLKSLGYTLKK